MTAIPPHLRLARILRGCAWCALGLVVAIAAMALMGWALGIAGLRSALHPRHAAMNPMTALGLDLSSLSLGLLMNKPARGSPRRKLAIGLAATVVLLGVLKLLSYRIAIPIDRLLFPVKSANNPIAPNTAIAFVTLG